MSEMIVFKTFCEARRHSEINACDRLAWIGAEYVEALVELVRIYAVTTCDACNQIEGAEICHHCKTAFALLASIEEAAKGLS